MINSIVNGLEQFRADGILKVSSAIDSLAIKEIQLNLWDEINQQSKVFLDKPSSWPSQIGEYPGLRLNNMNSILKNLKSSGKLQVLESSISHLINKIFSSDKWEPMNLWYSLISFPGTEKVWNIPQRSWHSDEPIIVGELEPWNIFVFIFLDTVKIENGPTVGISGSHKRGEMLANEIGIFDENILKAFESVNYDLIKDQAKAKLLPMDQFLATLTERDPWYHELVSNGSPEERIQKFMNKGTQFQNIEQKVIALTGEPGDIILFDPRCLHSYSANISNQPRQILRLDFKRNEKKN